MPIISDAILPLQIFLFATAVPLLMRIPIRKLERLVAYQHQYTSPSHRKVASILHWTAVYCRYARPLIPRLCLTRGLTHYYFLRRAGMEVDLVFGIGMQGSREGHCWLVLEGRPYLEKIDPRKLFLPMYTFGSKNECHGQQHMPDELA